MRSGSQTNSAWGKGVFRQAYGFSNSRAPPPPVPVNLSTDYEDSLVACNRRMLEKQLACDVKFKVGESQTTVGAHKYMLAARSDVFFTMFHGSLPQSDEILIPDIEMEPFMAFLRYLYCEEVELDGDSVLYILYCCKKYNVQSLLKKCVQFVENMMSIENVCSLLEQAHFFDEKELYKRCLSFIHQHGEQVLQTTHIGQLSRPCIDDIISSDDLNCSENVVFEAMIKWSESECLRQQKGSNDENKREVLGDMLYKIRFVLLGMPYFSSKVSTRNILNDLEKLRIFQLISGTEIEAGPFNSKQRNKHNQQVFIYSTPRFAGLRNPYNQ